MARRTLPARTTRGQPPSYLREPPSLTPQRMPLHSEPQEAERIPFNIKAGKCKISLNLNRLSISRNIPFAEQFTISSISTLFQESKAIFRTSMMITML